MLSGVVGLPELLQGKLEHKGPSSVIILQLKYI